MNSVLSLHRCESHFIDEVLRLAKVYEQRPISDVLKGKVVGLVFMNPSLRTAASMQAGAQQLGATCVVIQPGKDAWILETRTGAVMDGASQEHIRDAIPVLSQYCDLLGVRCFAANQDLAVDLADELIAQMAGLSSVPFLNLESAADHPCQAFADWKTLDDRAISREGTFALTWGWHPRPLPYAVPIAAAGMALRRGMKLRIVRPDGFQLPDSTMKELKSLGLVEEFDNRHEGLRGVDTLYVKSWCAPSAYGDPESEKALRAGLRDWCADETWLSEANPNAPFMHCLPIRRNVEATDALIEGPRSATLRQAANRLHVQKALMTLLLEKNL